MAEVGDIVKDKVSGLTGVVTGRAVYLYSCPQVLIVPRETKDGAPMSGTWLEESRTQITTDSPLEVGYRPPMR